MSIFMLILGILLGIIIKIGIEQYQFYEKEQRKTNAEMTDLLIKLKAIELEKDKK